MITIIAIVISIVVFRLVSNTLCKELILSAASLFVYYEFVGWYILLIPTIALLTYATIHFREKYINMQMVLMFVYCSILIIGLFILKYFITIWVFPVGYSILVFSGISAISDAKKNGSKYSFMKILCYLSFFPKLLAGPLEKIDPFCQQLIKPQDEFRNYYIGFKYIVFGLFSKYIIADEIGNYLSFSTCGINAVLEAICFAIQFYIDFWSYCNIAMGISMLYGIKLTRNFCNPYSANSFRQFWSRWNITLTMWLRDYIYIPLGGNRSGTAHWISNIIIVFLISGLWHGLTVAFLLWGLLHAIFYCIERFCLSEACKKSLIYKVLVLFFVMMMWQLFRLNSGSEILTYLAQFPTLEHINYSLLLTSIVSIIVLLLFESKQFQRLVFEYPTGKLEVVMEVFSISTMFIFFLLGNNNNNSPFFYFSF